MISQYHRQVPETVFMVKIAASEPLKRVTGRIIKNIKKFVEVNKNFKLNITAVSYSKFLKTISAHTKVLIYF
jgi:hypothetical protein